MGTTVKPPPIAGTLDVDPDRRLPYGGGLEAYVAIDRRDPSERLMAVRVPDGEAPRARPLSLLTQASVPSCLAPLAHGVARDAAGQLAQFVICRAPPGPALAALFAPAAAGEAAPPPWTEAELVDHLLRPAAAALAGLQARHVTHRAIRPDNVFQAARGQPVVLGCAWATSPGSRQPTVYEPAYLGVCAPACRDDGAIADDVYALGVLMVALGTGVEPLAGLHPAAVVARKLELGPLALLGAARLPSGIADLARGMLAEDPDHRPSPALLADPDAARARRVTSRPRRRAQRPLSVGERAASDARSLALILAEDPAKAMPLLRRGAVDQWLRRDLGESSQAALLEEAVRQRAADLAGEPADADALLLLRAVALLDPLAPLCWRGLFLWPAALGSALAVAPPGQAALLARMVETEAWAAWAAVRPQRSDPARAQQDARDARQWLRQRGWAGGVARLRYAVNSLLPCRSAVVAGALVLRALDLLPALAAAAEAPDRPPLPLDADLAAFLAARTELRMDAEFDVMAGSGAGSGAGPDAGPDGVVKADTALADAGLAQLRVLARLQGGAGSPALRPLAAWLGDLCAPLLARTRSRQRKQAAEAALRAAVAQGRLAGLLAVLDNPALLASDRAEADAAATALAALDFDLAAADRRLGVSRADARRIGREIVASVGLIALAAAVVQVLW